jgi:dTDP-4-dehydrorhamnose 3,5-epimerase
MPPGQAKYVTCFSGSVFDVVVDLRKGSHTFGKWRSVVIDSRSPSALYIPSGIGHAFMALEDNTTFVYLCDQRYNPGNEFDISPFDPTIAINWPSEIEPVLSEKDKTGASFKDLIEHFPDSSF